MLLGWIATLIMLLAIFLIPLGLPGLWIMVAVVGVGALMGYVGPAAVMIVVAVAAVAEVLEFLILRNMSARYGGSSRAFWGAVLGGLAGVVVGFPFPVIGPVIAGILGSFIGAAGVTLWEGRDLAGATRVGWGVVLARGIAAAAKVAAAIVILVVGGAAWVLR